MEWLFVISIVLLVYIYYGYGLLLKLYLNLFLSGKPIEHFDLKSNPKVTVLLTVHNEEERIARRLENLLSDGYPLERLEVLVASDGSTDRTHEIVREFMRTAPVKLYVSPVQVGKSETQNRAIDVASGEIVIFTDAETTFEKGCISEFARSFSDPRVGCVTGSLRFLLDGNTVSEAQGYYWAYEERLRASESELGLLLVASGQCMAIRRQLFRPIGPHVGEDCVVPLDVVLQGYHVKHAAGARAFDRMESEVRKEYRARVRMTLRNWIGTWERPSLLNPLKYPGYAFALWSHKVLRWLGPIFILSAISSSVFLGVHGDALFQVFTVFWLVAAMLALVGYLAEQKGSSVWLAGTVFSFALANVGFFVGTFQALSGKRVIAYRVRGTTTNGDARK